jgi:putative SOS response-associated peptidase YedK
MLVERTKGISVRTDAPIDWDEHSWKRLAESQVAEPKRFKVAAEDGRIYPNYYAPVVVASVKGLVVTPMRYQLRPHDAPGDLPRKYSLFNARLDMLETRRTWQPLFGRRHGCVPIKAFYEWVKHPETGKNAVIEFRPETGETLMAACLWDTWRSPDGKETLNSFAVITTDPPPEVSAMGHDRCPVILRAENLDAWLHPEGRSLAELYAILRNQADMTFTYKFAA